MLQQKNLTKNGIGTSYIFEKISATLMSTSVLNLTNNLEKLSHWHNYLIGYSWIFTIFSNQLILLLYTQQIVFDSVSSIHWS